MQTDACALTRRRLLAAASAMLVALVARAESAAKPDEIGWPALIPAGWKPGKAVLELQALGELPDDDPRVVAASKRARTALDAAPTVAGLNQKRVKLPGFVVPLETGREGLKEFLLVPYFGACIHVPAPPANQIVHVRTAEPIKGIQTMSTVWVSGVIEVARSAAEEGVSGYRVFGAKVERYTGK